MRAAGFLRQDVRHGVRVAVRSPLFAVVTVLVLALGIGANTAMFGILNALVLRKLPVRDPDRIVEMSVIYRGNPRVPLSFPMFREIGQGQRVFSGVIAWSPVQTSSVDIHGALSREGVRGVTGNYFAETGASPLLGRLLTPEDARQGTNAFAAVIDYDFWDSRFGRDPAALGKSIRIDGTVFTIVGITRRWFTGMSPGDAPAIWIPITAPQFDRDSRALLWITAAGRLKDGVTPQQARAQLQSFWPAALLATAPTQTPGARRDAFLAMRLQVEPAGAGVRPRLRDQVLRPVYIVTAIVGLILLVVSVNLASLTLSRAAARGHEISTRIALGANRWRIVRQFLTESLLFSAAGALAGLLFASWASQFLMRLMTSESAAPLVLDLRPDWRVFCFTAIAALAAGLLVGAAPALQMSRAEPIAVLRQTARGLGQAGGRLGKALIVTQIALSLVLLQGAGIFVRTLGSLRAFDPGFQKDTVLGASLQSQPGADKSVDWIGYRKTVLERIGNLPGVLSAAFSNLEVPAGEHGWSETVTAAGDSNPNGGVQATLVVVSPGFFKTLGIPIVAGRDFEWTDTASRPRIAILDGSLARRFPFPGGRVRFGVQPEFQDLEIVGVARSARLIDLRNADAAVIYVPGTQHPGWGDSGNLFVRAPHAGALGNTVAREVRSLGQEYSTATMTLAETSDRSLLRERATAVLAGFFAAVALLLAGIGLFGLMSYSVSRRTREVGIRMALGSPRRDILRMILRETVRLTLAGIAIGIPCAIATARLATHMLFGVSAADPFTLAAVSSTLVTVGAIAGWLPARRAMNLDPLTALRYE